MAKILFINIRIYLNININKQTNFKYDFWLKVKALAGMQQYQALLVTNLRSRLQGKGRQGKFICIAQFRHKATQSASQAHTNDIKRHQN